MVSAESPAGRLTRRRFLIMTGGTVSMASMSSSASGYFVGSLPVRTVEKTRFRFNADKGLIEWEKGRREGYGLIVGGLVENPAVFSYADLLAFPRVRQVSDLHCVEGWSVKDLEWGGFRFQALLDRIRPKREAAHVLFHSLGTTGSSPRGQSHYIESLPLSELLDPRREILLVLTLDNRPLPEDHGAPLRLIAPYDLAYKSIKFIHRVEFIEDERAGWWTLANPIYPVVARVPQSRLRKKS